MSDYQKIMPLQSLPRGGRLTEKRVSVGDKVGDIRQNSEGR